MARKSYSDKEREQVKEALLITVLESIVNQGLVHSSIAILCEKVGISKTFFYSFFSSKEELVMQALRYQQPKLLRYAQELMNDPKLSWRESVKTFLKNCCYGEKVGFAVLSIEEEQQVYIAAFPTKIFKRFVTTSCIYIATYLQFLAFRWTTLIHGYLVICP